MCRKYTFLKVPLRIKMYDYKIIIKIRMKETYSGNMAKNVFITQIKLTQTLYYIILWMNDYIFIMISWLLLDRNSLMEYYQH